MALKHLVAVAIVGSAGLLASGCLRLMDEPAEEGATGVDCFEEKDCQEGTHCLLLNGSGVCGEPGECSSHSHCGDRERCLMARCEPVECTGDYDEPDTICGAYRCDDATYTCSKKCEKDFDCTTGNVCRGGACLSEKCTAQNAALICQGYGCDTVLGKCREQNYGECEDHGCAVGYVCIDKSKCLKSCSSTSGSTTQCGNYRCTTKNLDYPNTVSYCEERCFEHTDCLNGTVCVQGKCGPKP